MSIIEQIKAEIERQEKQCPLDTYEGRHKLFILGGLKTFLSTLESEKPMNQEGLDKEISKIWETCEPVDEGMGVETANIHIEQFDYLARHFAEWGYLRAAEKYDKIEYNRQMAEEHLADARKTSPKGLEEASSEFATYRASNGVSVEFLYEKLSFQEGSKWQKEQDDKEISEKIAAAYQLGLADKEKQMMQEALNGWLDEDNEPPYDLNVVCEEKIPFGEFKHGDKVRIIIIKED